MKKTILALALTSSCTLAWANGPIIEPGPVQPMSEDGITVANLITNTQVKPCVDQIADSGYKTAWRQVTVQNIDPSTKTYRFAGTAWIGDDVVLGDSVLNVTQTLIHHPRSGWKATYTCNVILPKR